VDNENRKRTFRVRWYHKLLLIALGVVLAVAVIEYVNRHYHLMPLPGDAEYRALSKEIGPMLLSYDRFENSGFLVGNTEFAVEVRLNKLNFRGDDISKQPPEDARRVVLVGDSHTANWEVEADEMWSVWLDQWLNQGQQAYDVVNLGFPGWGTDREHLMYQAYGSKLNADVVVLVVYVENDVHENGIALWVDEKLMVDLRPYFTLDDNGELIKHPWHYTDKTRAYMDQAFPKNVIGWLNANSLTYRLTRDAVRGVWDFVTGQETEADDLSAAAVEAWQAEIANPTYIPAPLESIFTEPDERWQVSWRITAELIEAFRDVVRADGAELVVAVVPPHMIVQDDYWHYEALFDASERAWDRWYPQNRLLELLDALEIPVINPTQTFIDFRAETGQDVFYPLDKHFTPIGSCVFGTALANGLVEVGIVKPDAGYPRDPGAECR
jgi:hypothetical protein